MNTLKLLTLVKIYINTYFCQALARYSSRSYCKGTGRVLKKKISSRGLRTLFGWPSGLLRTCVGSSSGALRLLVGCSSGRSRSTLEADSKPSRSVAEHVSNMSRRGPEALPKPSRRGEGVAIPIRLRLYFTYICQALAGHANRLSCKGAGRLPKKEAVPSSDFLMTNTLPTPYFILPSHWFCITFPLALFGSDPRKTNVSPEQHSKSGRSWSGVGRYLGGLFPATKGTIDSRLSYRECTESVPKRYWKGTKELLKRYQIATKQVQAFGSFLVDRRYKLGRAMEIPTKMHSGDLVSGGDGCCLKSEGLQAFCDTRVCKNEYLAVQKKIGAQKALKYFSVVAGYGKGYRMSLTCLLLMIVSMFSLSAQTPRKDSGADGLSSLVALKPGDKIPDAVWNRSLELNYFNGKKKTIKFAELKGKLIILDFWSTGCPACISGIPNLELIRDRFKGEIEILMINSKRNKDTPKRIENRFKKYKTDFNYVPTIATLLDDTLFTRLFNHNTLPTQAVINAKGEFLALLSGTAQLTDRNIKKILYENDNPLNSTGIYLNKIDGKRNFEVLITDTAGLSYSSSFSNYREHYIPIGPLWKVQKSNSLLIMGNLSLQNFMTYIFRDELEGFAWTDYVFDPRLGLDFKYRLFNTAKENTYWYQFYRNDSIAEAKAKEVARQDFMRYFDVSVQRKSDSISIYKVSFNKAIEKIKTKGQMMIIRRQEQDQELLYQNVPVDLFLRNLFYFFESPLYKTGKEAFRIDIAIPPGFIHWEEDQKITFLRNNGIILTPVREKREFAYIYSLK